ALVVCVLAFQIIDVHRGECMVRESLEELASQVNVEAADVRAGVRYVVEESGAAGRIDDHSRECFVQWYVGMAVAAHAGLIAHGGGKGLAQRDADIFHGVVVVDVDVTVAMDVEVDQAMAGDLVQHVVQEGDTGVDTLTAGAVKIDGYPNTGLLGVAGNVGCTHVRLGYQWIQDGTRRWRHVREALRRGPARMPRGPASALRRAIP